MRHFWILLAVPVCVASCGGSDSASTTTRPAHPRLTQQEFVAAANKICIRSDRRIYQLGRLSIEPAGWAETALVARTGVAEMAALRPPASEATQFRRFISLGQRLADGIQHTHDALVKKDYAAARTAQTRATEADTAIHKLAQRLGLTFCQQLLTNWPA